MDDNIMYFQDENGGQIALQMVDAFEYEAVKYAVFATPENQLEPNQQPDLYVMKAIYNEDGDEIINFEMPSEEEVSQVTPHIISRYEQPSCGGSCSGCSGCHH